MSYRMKSFSWCFDVLWRPLWGSESVNENVWSMFSSLVVSQGLWAAVQWTSQHDDAAWISTGRVHPEMDAITVREWRTSPCLLCCSDQQVSTHVCLPVYLTFKMCCISAHHSPPCTLSPMCVILFIQFLPACLKSMLVYEQTGHWSTPEPSLVNTFLTIGSPSSQWGAVNIHCALNYMFNGTFKTCFKI